MKIVEFHCEHPILRESLREVPEMELEWIQSDIRDARERIHGLFWARGGDFEAFEATIDRDPTITTLRRSIETEDRRFYQLEIIGETIQSSLYPLLVEEGCIVQDLRGTSDGWEYRIAFPNEQTISKVFSFCSQAGIPVTIHRIYEERSHDEYGPTERQQQAIEKALEIGYFDVPRKASLGDLGNQLGISDTAASQRLRRGLKTVLERTANASNGDVQQGESSLDRRTVPR